MSPCGGVGGRGAQGSLAGLGEEEPRLEEEGWEEGEGEGLGSQPKEVHLGTA